MANLVIVAIPAEDDYVHKISSEKVPHCTLAFLGDPLGQPVLKIQQFLEHAVNILEFGPFGLEVDHRGTLGDQEADVLFFRDNWSLKRLKEFRGQLLKDHTIRTAFDEADQFAEYPDSWIPHLTLGYPRAPAREDDRDYPGIRWVEFDRIALWYGDYEGAEFRLEYNYHDLAEVAMSGTAAAGKRFAEDYLKHYGVRGMRWGFRKDTGGSVATTTRTNVGVTGKTKIKAKGGHGAPAHPDAVKAAVAKKKLKTSGTAALGTQELRDLANRLQLEQQVSILSSGQGKKFVQQQIEAEKQGAGAAVRKSAKKKAAKVAVTALA